MTKDERAVLFGELRHIADETREFNYVPARFLQDLATSDPSELIVRYVLAPRPSAGLERLWREGRLDVAVENAAWKYRHLFPPAVGEAAAKRLKAAGFDVHTQRLAPARSSRGR
jgi:hypothetical protein